MKTTTPIADIPAMYASRIAQLERELLTANALFDSHARGDQMLCDNQHQIAGTSKHMLPNVES